MKKSKQPETSSPTHRAYNPPISQYRMFTKFNYCLRNHNLPLLDKADDLTHGINLVQGTTSNAKADMQKLWYSVKCGAIKYSF